MENDSISSVRIHNQKVIPSDTFTISGNEYVLLDIVREAQHPSLLLKIMGLNNDHAGTVVMISVDNFEKMQKDDFKNFINSYQK